MDIFSKPRDFIDETRDPREPKKPLGIPFLNCSGTLIDVDDYPYFSFMEWEVQ